MREVIQPTDDRAWLELRTHDLTSTDIASLFHCSPYSSIFETWHRKKKAQVIESEGTEQTRWGLRLQDSIAEGAGDEIGMKPERMKEYIRLPMLRLGSSFDYSLPDEGLLEVKNVFGKVFREQWLVDDGKIEAPPHIEMQVQHQLFVSGRKYAYIAALISGMELKLLRREPIDSVQKAIVQKAGEFWQSVIEDRPPEPDFARDAKFISELYQDAKGGVLNAVTDVDLANLAEIYKSASELEKTASKTKEATKAKMLMRIGDAHKVMGKDFTISCGEIGEADVSYHRNAYRGWRVTWTK